MGKQRISARGRAIMASVAVHLLLFAVLGAVEFSRPDAEMGLAKVSQVQISRVLAASSVIPKPKVLSRDVSGAEPSRVSDIQFDSMGIDQLKVPAFNEAEKIAAGTFMPTRGDGRGSVTEIFGSTTESRRIVYVVDVSGSMHGMLAEVRDRLKESIESLMPDNFFYIIFFGGDGIIESGSGKLIRATSTAKRKAFTQIDIVRAGGGTNADEAVARALTVINQSDRGEGQIYFLSDGFDLEQGQSDKFCDYVENLRKSLAPSVRISTIGFWMDQADREMFAEIAVKSGGEFVHVE